jgi:uncharacterized membrane protein YbhN (UPF0104 family)
MLTLLGLFIIALAELVYNHSANAGSTDWSIYYFGSIYLAVTIISADLLFRENSKVIQACAFSFGVFFIILLVLELLFINVPYNDYIEGVNDNKVRFLAMGVLSIILIFISFTAWEKRRSKK